MNRWWWVLPIAGCCAVIFWGGYEAGKSDAPVRIEVKEVVKWRERTVTVANTSANAVKQQNVRVVTKWLRPDGTTSREQTRESASQATTAIQQSVATSRQSTGERFVAVSARPTAVPRLSIGGLLGLDLRAGLNRRWGAYATYRIAGPVHVGGFAMPGLVGAMAGVTF